MTRSEYEFLTKQAVTDEQVKHVIAGLSPEDLEDARRFCREDDLEMGYIEVSEEDVISEPYNTHSVGSKVYGPTTEGERLFGTLAGTYAGLPVFISLGTKTLVQIPKERASFFRFEIAE